MLSRRPSMKSWCCGAHRCACGLGMRACYRWVCPHHYKRHRVAWIATHIWVHDVVRHWGKSAMRVWSGIARARGDQVRFLMSCQPPLNLLWEPARGGVCTSLVLVSEGAVREHRVRPASPPASPRARRQRRVYEQVRLPQGAVLPHPLHHLQVAAPSGPAHMHSIHRHLRSRPTAAITTSCPPRAAS